MSLARVLVLLLGMGTASSVWALGPTDVLDVVPVPDARQHAPGPRSLGLKGPHVDPSTILGFDGRVALAYFTGHATDGTGRPYRLLADMRVFQGAYVAADATTKQGTFGFI